MRLILSAQARTPVANFSAFETPSCSVGGFMPDSDGLFAVFPPDVSNASGSGVFDGESELIPLLEDFCGPLSPSPFASGSGGRESVGIGSFVPPRPPPPSIVFDVIVFPLSVVLGMGTGVRAVVEGVFGLSCGGGFDATSVNASLILNCAPENFRGGTVGRWIVMIYS